MHCLFAQVIFKLTKCEINQVKLIVENQLFSSDIL